jgi:hypothetical protein
MRTRVMEDSQGYYNLEEEFICLHVNMGNFEIDFDGRGGR